MPAHYKSKPLLGFPVEFVFQSQKELDEYFGAERIQCLQCGRWFRSLGVHLKAVHGMEPDEYRAIYGIPWRRGLQCAMTFEKHSELSKYYQAIGKAKPQPPEILSAARRLPRRPKQPVTIKTATERFVVINQAKGRAGEKTRAKYAAYSKTPEEHKARLRARPQCQRNGAMIKAITWKKQSPEHLRKRMASMAITILPRKLSEEEIADRRKRRSRRYYETHKEANYARSKRWTDANKARAKEIQKKSEQKRQADALANGHPCECGCGENVARGKRYVHGHQVRVRWRDRAADQI